MSHPTRLLNRVLWVNRAERYPDIEKFNKEISQYHFRILESDERWTPDVVALESGQVQICFQCWTPEGEDIEPVITLKADNERAFTTLELMHKLSDGLGAYLLEHSCELYDHCFFEGLSLAEGERAIPLYFINFGS